MKQQNLEDPILEEFMEDVPVVALRDTIVFPHTMFPILAGRNESVQAVNAAHEDDGLLMLCAQKNPETEQPDWDQLYETGTLVRITQLLRLPNNLVKVLINGVAVARVISPDKEKGHLSADIQVVHPDESDLKKAAPVIKKAKQKFEQFVMLNSNLPEEILLGFQELVEPMAQLYFMASYLDFEMDEQQELLECPDVSKCYKKVLKQLLQQIQLYSVSSEIDQKVQNEIKEHQRKFYIQQQIKALQEELDEDDFGDPELARLREKVDSLEMPEHARDKAVEELDRLKKTPPMSPEYSVGRNYLDWLLSMPWGTYTEDQLDIEAVEKALEEDHYGLEKPKERILEYIAVLNLVDDLKGQILCFAGPPGTGKTSLANSIARAMKRNTSRLALGGVHDEAEIRGHRKTYIGAMPGRIVQAIQKAGSMNPVVILDEIDKLGHDHRGDPSSAVLEVLDPEQNHSFADHYLDLELDLSRVLFITTANVASNIQPALRDRMEIINLPGYLEPEKVKIAERHLIPRQLDAHGLKKVKVIFKEEALRLVIRSYTRESGVRLLERQISKICRKIARKAVQRARQGKQLTQITINTDRVEEFLGVAKYRDRSVDQKPQVGSVNGVAWTNAGGALLQIDVARMKGKNKFELTGQMGDVMKESARTALSYIRSHSDELKLEDEYFENHEIHIHIPEGAIPKDGPSAGLPMLLAMISLLTGKPARKDVATTGEITLRGEVLAIGGLNEKMLAAQRHKLSKLIIPKDNHPDLDEVPEEVKQGLKVVEVNTVEEAIAEVFE